MTDKVPARVIVHRLTDEQQQNDYVIKLYEKKERNEVFSS